ncbi:unnamed protein product [Closterium sp. NIES-54]
MARSSTVLPCPAVLSSSLSGPHLPSFSANLVSTAALQDAMVTTTTPGGQRLTICTCTRTGRHLATFTGSCICSGVRVRSLPPLPPSPAPPCLSCIEGRQRAALHSSSFPPTTTTLQTLHMDVWGPARVSGQSRERYFLLVVDDYTRYTTVFPFHSRVRSGGEFSSDLLRDFCCGEGILQLFTLPDSPQQNGIADRRIGLVMEVGRTSMIHAASPHFLRPFAVQYAPHQLNLWPRVSLTETLPTLRWTGEVGDASVFRGPTPSSVSQVDPLPGLASVQVAVSSGAARGAGSRGSASGGADPGGAESECAGSWGAEPGGAESEGAESGGAEPRAIMALLSTYRFGGERGCSPKSVSK